LQSYRTLERDALCRDKAQAGRLRQRERVSGGEHLGFDTIIVEKNKIFIMVFQRYILFLLIIICSCKSGNNERLKGGLSSKNKIYRLYFENGNIKSELSMLNKLKNGVCKWYYETGVLKIQSNYIQDIEVGETFYYYNNRVLQSYNFFDIEGNLRFNVQYDTTGMVKEHSGKNLYLVKQLIKKDSSSIALIGIKVFIAKPPYSNIEVVFKDLKNNNFLKYNVLPQGNSPLFLTNYNDKEQCDFMVVAQINDTLNDISFIDTAYYHKRSAQSVPSKTKSIGYN
jgi:hypothetical protein